MLGIPFVVEGPLGSHLIIAGRAHGLLEIVVEPMALTTFANAMIIIDAIAPRTGIEHFIGIGILDVSIENLL